MSEGKTAPVNKDKLAFFMALESNSKIDGIEIKELTQRKKINP